MISVETSKDGVLVLTKHILWWYNSRGIDKLFVDYVHPTYSAQSMGGFVTRFYRGIPIDLIAGSNEVAFSIMGSGTIW